METSHVVVEAGLLDAVLPEGARVLEAGCGRTTRLGFYRDRIAELVGVDVDPEAGRQNAALDRFVCTDICAELPFDDATFDVVYANFVVEHLSCPPRAFAEWRRVVKYDGAAVLVTSNIANPYMWLARRVPHSARIHVKRVGAGAVERDVIPAVYRANTPYRLVSAMREAGFTKADLVTVATLHRYAGDRRALASLLRAAERVLPSAARSTIVASFRAG